VEFLSEGGEARLVGHGEEGAGDGHGGNRSRDGCSRRKCRREAPRIGGGAAGQAGIRGAKTG
jgi:hypothetical protein